jgi:RNA polymerase sigma-70 factor (ECF subfamily)
MDDAALVRQVLAGHTNAYAQLVQRWAGRILALCHARVARADVAEELAQETLVRGFEELTSLAEPGRFGPWLAGIATNTCRDWLKARQNGQVPFSALAGAGEAVPQPQAPPCDEVERRDEAGRVQREVEALPEELRTVLLLFYYQQASYRDIAHLLDVSPATVNARLTRARALLRERLGAAHATPGS